MTRDATQTSGRTVRRGFTKLYVVLLVSASVRARKHATTHCRTAPATHSPRSSAISRPASVSRRQDRREVGQHQAAAHPPRIDPFQRSSPSSPRQGHFCAEPVRHSGGSGHHRLVANHETSRELACENSIAKKLLVYVFAYADYDSLTAA
jgi:hypothetical protein